MAGSFLSSMAGAVLDTMIAENFLGGHGWGHGDLAQPDEAHHAPPTDHGQDADHADAGRNSSDTADGFDDIGGDFDGGSIDV